MADDASHLCVPASQEAIHYACALVCAVASARGAAAIASCFFWRQEQKVCPEESHGTGRSPKSVGGDVEEVSCQKAHRTGRSPKGVGGDVLTSLGDLQDLRIPGNHCG